MILVDTSVWVEHLRRGVPRLAALLEQGEVGGHPFVVGELACGNLRGRSEVLGFLAALPQVVAADHGEVLALLERHRAGRGLGLIDGHLLAACRLSGAPIWTLDRRLEAAARDLDLSAR